MSPPITIILNCGCARNWHEVVGLYGFWEGNIQGTFREHSGNIQGTFREPFREHSVKVERTPVSLHPNCKKHLKKVPRLTQNTTCKHEYLRLMGTFREHSWNIQGTFREREGNVKGTCR
jgi:hypothetical protein